MATVDNNTGVTGKKCTKCKKVKFLMEFNSAGQGNNKRRRGDCKECQHAADAIRYATNPEKYKRQERDRRRNQRRNPALRAQIRNAQLLADYGISLDEFNKILVDQGGTCAICHQPETRKTVQGNVRDLSVDHDHINGIVRGLLCSACNMALGYFQDDPGRLQAAINYLQGASLAGNRRIPI